MNQVTQYIIEQTKLSSQSIEAVLKLLFEESCTVPFITRYRKEKTGGLDEVQIFAIQEHYEHFLEREKRRTFILETMTTQGVLTDKLKAQILKASLLSELEDIYAPFKTKRKTKAMKAIEAGLEPLALILQNSGKDLAAIEREYGTQFLNKEHEINDFQAALEGAKHIIMEDVSHHLEIKQELRSLYWNEAKLVSSKRKDAEEVKEYLKFKDYFEFDQKIKELATPKAAHRFLAMRRGQMLKILKLAIEVDTEHALNIVMSYFPFKMAHPSVKKELDSALDKTYQSSIHSSLDLEIKTELKQKGDEAAIDVFRNNLRDLLLAPYLGAKTVLGVDPGIRTGCKLAVVDHTGKFCEDAVIYPHPPQNQVDFGIRVVEAFIKKYDVKYIAIGNGTYGRETYQILKDKLPSSNKVEILLISEAGASVYSTSEIARNEFPDYDPTVRGAISIARRFQDPLAELVKIDPKSIGVGQYQHDVNQAKLKKSLGQVVESCVNFVGVDLNTASAPLLSYISGIGASVAQNIVKYRESKGAFKSRAELLSVGRFSPKIFQQAAGFMRIYQGESPLDKTSIHPENYHLIETWCAKNKATPIELVAKKELRAKLKNDHSLEKELGSFTFKDIIESLEAPSQDPRSEFINTAFRDDAKSLSDIKKGEWYPGVINNLTQFGAFVDIGIKQSGLLHISQMADRFVEDPTALFKVGEEVKVKVIDIDIPRERLSLSMKSDAQVNYSSSQKKSSSSPVEIKNAPLRNKGFDGLKNLKMR